MSSRELKIGFIQLADAAVVIAAHELGFDALAGLRFSLQRESSWANIRDKLAVGLLDAAHCLAPLVLAGQSIGAALPLRLSVPYMLNRGGVSIALSSQIKELVDAGTSDSLLLRSAQAVARAVRMRQHKSASPARFAAVFPFSSHYYAMRHWLASAGLKADRDYDLIVLPPSLMVDALASGQIDGFIAGAPWPLVAARQSCDTFVVDVDSSLSPVPEKAFAVQSSSMRDQPAELEKVVTVLDQAARWCAAPENRQDLARLLAQTHYLAMEAGLVEQSLVRMNFHGISINRPDPVLARWYATHMLSCGQLRADATLARLTQPFDPAIYDRVFGLTADKPDYFSRPLFDGSRFEADHPDAFLQHLRPV